jgi:hypothetical protein
MKKYTKKNKDSSKRKNGSRSRFKTLLGPADEIDAICRKKLPDGVIRSGNLVGREPEIRQDALIMALSGYLEGHPGYRSAKESGNQANKGNEMERCVAMVLQICKRRMDSNLFKDLERHVPITDQNGGICVHSSDWNTSDWPLSVRARVALRAADQAVKAKKLSPMNALILDMVVSKGMNVDEISGKIDVSNNAIYQQLRRVRKVLPEIVRNLEP